MPKRGDCLFPHFNIRLKGFVFCDFLEKEKIEKRFIEFDKKKLLKLISHNKIRGYKMNLSEIMNSRFEATPIPSLTGDAGKDVESIIQWLLEFSLLKDFVYRNPDREKGKEFSDAVAIYDDIIIIIQIKTQKSSRNPIGWAEKNLQKAIKQLNGSFRMLSEGIVTEFKNEVLGTKIKIDLAKHKCIYGVIILAQSSQPYNPLNFISQSNWPKIPFNIFSLNDFEITCRRMTTAGDLIVYIELRWDAKDEIKILINDEENNMLKIAPLLPQLLRNSSFRKLELSKQENTIKIYSKKLKEEIMLDPDFKYSLLVDDIISRAHDIDISVFGDSEDVKNSAHKIAICLGYLTRERRIRIGKKILEFAIKAKDGRVHKFVHLQKPIKQIYLYIFGLIDQKDLGEYLKALCAAAQVKYGYNKVLGILTEPIGNGRSYSFVFLEKKHFPSSVQVPDDILKQLPDLCT